MFIVYYVYYLYVCWFKSKSFIERFHYILKSNQTFLLKYLDLDMSVALKMPKVNTNTFYRIYKINIAFCNALLPFFRTQKDKKETAGI